MDIEEEGENYGKIKDFFDDNNIHNNNFFDNKYLFYGPHTNDW